jgi:hypothetical protein
MAMLVPGCAKSSLMLLRPLGIGALVYGLLACGTTAGPMMVRQQSTSILCWLTIRCDSPIYIVWCCEPFSASEFNSVSDNQVNPSSNASKLYFIQFYSILFDSGLGGLNLFSSDSLSILSDFSIPKFERRKS